MSFNVPTSIDPLLPFYHDSLAQRVYRDLHYYFPSVPAAAVVRTVKNLVFLLRHYWDEVHNMNYLKVHVVYIELYESEAARYIRELSMIGVMGVGGAKEARKGGNAGEVDEAGETREAEEAEKTAKANQKPRETREAVPGSNTLINLLDKNRGKKLSIIVNEAPGKSRILLECEEEPSEGDFFLDIFAPLVDRSVEEVFERMGKPMHAGSVDT